MMHFIDGGGCIFSHNRSECMISVLLHFKNEGLFLKCFCTHDNPLFELINYITLYKFKVENSIYVFNERGNKVFNHFLLG